MAGKNEDTGQTSDVEWSSDDDFFSSIISGDVTADAASSIQQDVGHSDTEWSLNNTANDIVENEQHNILNKEQNLRKEVKSVDTNESQSTTNFHKEHQDSSESKEEIKTVPRQKDKCFQNKEAGSDASSDENVPLAQLRNVRKHQPVKRRLIEDIGDIDDSDRDEPYNPDKDDVNSTDSEAEEILKDRKKKRKNKRTRDKAWKKKPTSIMSPKLKRVRSTNAKKTTTGNGLRQKYRRTMMLLNARRKRKNIEQGLSDIERAKRVSQISQTLKMKIRKYHEARLDQLLESNEKKRKKVNADGNCFFEAILQSAPDLPESNADGLRDSISDFLSQNEEQYSPFIAKQNEDKNQFREELNNLRNRGVWNSNIADCMPLAIADRFHRIVRIYSSSIATPVVDIKPSNWNTGNSYKFIEIAYVSIAKEEHYDATMPMLNLLQKDMTSDQTTDDLGQKTPTKVGLSSNNAAKRCPPVTPHKRAYYESPNHKLSTRKRKRNPNTWKANVRKRQRCEGKEYISRSGKKIKAKMVKPINCEKCKFKCSEHFSEAERQQIFDMYYSLSSYERQRCYICSVVSQDSPMRSSVGKRSKSLKCSLVLGDKTERVCQRFLCNTLDIGMGVVHHAMDKKKHGTFVGKDMRGRKSPATKLSDEVIDSLHKHINTFPKMESHHTRKQSKKQYLAHDLNIKKMWTLYVDACKKEEKPYVKQSKYRQVFTEHFNLAFFKPKKYQCSICAKYGRHKASNTITDDIQREYVNHQQAKREAREEKEFDKHKAMQNKNYCVVTFDLQAVLTTPCSLVSELYYSRKLCVYNLTMYTLADKKAICHMRDETNGKRGSCEIATCLLKNSQSLCQSNEVDEITYFSDTCGGQNRNQFVAASYLYTISKLPQLKALNHKFLQSGHSQMECDSVHSTIEQAKKRTSVYVPSQWNTVICMSRKGNPYITIPLKYNHILDFKSFVKQYKLNLQTLPDGKTRVNWLNVRWIRVEREHPRSLFVNYTFDKNKFIQINTQRANIRQKGRPKVWPESDSDLNLCYTSRLPISAAKKSDLVKPCAKEIIPEEYHEYYSSLPADKNCKDYIPESMSDDSGSSDIE